MRKLETVTVAKAVSFTCDRCGMDALVDSAEGCEFLSISETGGYGSVFGDGTTYEIDLCQHCVKQTLGEWMRTRSDFNDFSDHGC